MNDIKLYSTIIKICNDNDFKLLKFFIVDNLKKKMDKKRFLLILLLSNKMKNKLSPLYIFFNKYIINNHDKILKHYSKL